MSKFVLIPVAFLTFLSPAVLLTVGPSQPHVAAPADEIEAAVLRAERDLKAAEAKAPFAS